MGGMVLWQHAMQAANEVTGMQCTNMHEQILIVQSDSWSEVHGSMQFSCCLNLDCSSRIIVHSAVVAR